MRDAIAVTLVFAALTSALGGRRNWTIFRKTGHQGGLVGAGVGAAMTAWFLFAAYWLLTQ
ncbi:MAG: hypothetical protein RB191_25010 [Terriglobia bacterium]|nr:hypothetical protein [Terriglobia bacterium]